jgi:hypothetical protein
MHDFENEVCHFIHCIKIERSAAPSGIYRYVIGEFHVTFPSIATILKFSLQYHCQLLLKRGNFLLRTSK